MAKHLTTFLEEKLEKLRDDWTPQELELAKGIAQDIADLTLQGIAGGDVAAELEQAHAAADAMVGAATVSLSKTLYDGVVEFLADLLGRLVKP